MSSELDDLHEAVVSLAFSSGHFQADMAEVARLHSAVAAMRMGDDPYRFRCLMDQASFHASAGQLDAARGTVALAATYAESKGNVVPAADAWVTAILLARQAGDLETAERARGRAEWLATSPHMSPEESARVAARLYAEQWKIGGVPPDRVLD